MCTTVAKDNSEAANAYDRAFARIESPRHLMAMRSGPGPYGSPRNKDTGAGSSVTHQVFEMTVGLGTFHCHIGLCTMRVLAPHHSENN